jgi:predicted nucleotidyltransferase
MAAVNEQLLRDMTRVIVDQVHPVRVVLFGSHAHGTARAESDVDLLVITREGSDPSLNRRKTAAQLWRSLARFHVPVDLVLYSEREVDEWRDSSNHLSTRALREGRVLHD